MADSVLLSAWRQGEPAPVSFSSGHEAATVDDETSYFSYEHKIYSFTIADNKWTQLPLCEYKDFSMAVIEHNLTTIGGKIDLPGTETNTLLSLIPGHVWKEVLPPMPTSRVQPAAITTQTHLVVTGGYQQSFCGSDSVEILDLNTKQWFIASCLPESIMHPQMVLCENYLYLSKCSSVFSCSLDDLLRTCKPPHVKSAHDKSVWKILADTPLKFGVSLAARGSYLLAIGGIDDTPTAAIHCYNKLTNSWNEIGQLTTPLSFALATVLPSSEMVVVGGSRKDSARSYLCFYYIKTN